MRLNILIIAAFLFVMVGCDGSNYKYYEKGDTGIHFDVSDSIAISYTKYVGTTIEYKIPIEINGYSTDYDRYFVLKIDESATATTAKVGLHYKALEDKYTLPAGMHSDSVTIVLYNTDIALETSTMKLKIDLIPGDEFIAGNYYGQSVTLHVSNMYIKPDIWDSTLGYARYFGEYSVTKHKLILAILGIDEIPEVFDGSTYQWESYGIKVNRYFLDNPGILDENGIEIKPWF